MSHEGERSCHARAWRRIGGASLLAAHLLRSADAWGQDIERARQLFDEAATLRESGNYADALVRLRLAIAIKDTPGLQYHAGFCEAKLGHYTKAIRHFEQAAALIRAGANAPDVASLLNEAHKSAAEHVAHVRVTLAPLPPGATLQVDDDAEQPLPSHELTLDPGTHRVRVQAPGHASQLRELSLHDAEVLDVELKLVPLVQPDSTRQDGSPSPSRWRTAGIAAGLGMTALGLATGIISIVGRHNASVSEQAARDGGAAQSARLAAAQHDKQTYSTWETVGFVTAGLGAATTLAFWTLWPTSPAVSVAVAPDGTRHVAARLAFTSSF